MKAILLLLSLFSLCCITSAFMNLDSTTIPTSPYSSDSRVTLSATWVSGDNMFYDMQWGPNSPIVFDISLRTGRNGNQNGSCIVFNTYQGGTWGAEIYNPLPIVQGPLTIDVQIVSNQFQVSIYQPSSKQSFSFPVRLDLSTASGLAFHPNTGFNRNDAQIQVFDIRTM